ncbi:MAG TPA: MBL fold metallo-hydrolase [Candidatus Binatus sp.]|uniref:MBL fold metallo-hydrolase n=1 Tax=Candidatus Binatus sp. TaxID=2811406 RepID=UPI002B4764FA|nr:MBL fold metallo-hydrolase [Candidatus Binatus sp.]HKN14863.1 MBL fold metallo-hydrolase [Candidatus Binatus sp.]
MSSTPNPNRSNNLPGFDPQMGQLEVLEPGIAMFHGFANVAFAYGRGEMIVVDTSSRLMGAMAARAIREVSDEPFAFLIYTHGHGDHAFGTEAFITDALTRGHARPKIWRTRTSPAASSAMRSLADGSRISIGSSSGARSRPTACSSPSRSATPTWFIAINNFSNWWESRSSCITRWARRTTRRGSGCRRGGSRWSAI